MSRATLLWLLEHGDLVWQAALAIVALAALALGVRRARQKAAIAAAARRAPLGTPVRAVGKLREGPATLAGKLEAPALDGEMAAADVAYQREGEWEAIATARAERLALVVGEERVAIEGPVEVVVGSREAPIARVPAALAAQLDGWKQSLPGLVTRMRTLAPGDEVWAVGVVAEEVVDAGGAYRERPVRWRLSPAAGARLVSLANAGAPRPRWRALVGWSAAHLVGAGLLFLGVFGIGGEIAFARLEETLGVAPPGRVKRVFTAERALRTTALAAITPFRREAAAGLLRNTLDNPSRLDPASLQLREELARERCGCPCAAAVRIDNGELESGAEMAEGCGLHATAAHAYYVAGRFDRASLAWERARDPRDADVDWLWGRWGGDRQWLLFGTRVHLLAGRPELAAAAADQLGTGMFGPWQKKPGPPGAPLFEFKDDAWSAFCVAAAIAARHGDARARHFLDEPPPIESAPVCAVVLADLLEGRERLAFLDGHLREEVLPTPFAVWRGLLEVEADPVRHDAVSMLFHEPFDPSRVFTEPVLAFRGVLPAVERAVADLAPRTSPRTHAHVAAASAAFAAVAGDGETSERLVTTALAAAPLAGDPA